MKQIINCLLMAMLVFHNVQAATPWSGIIAASRAMDWSQAGVVGGIPSASWAQCVTTACAALATAAYVTAANINTAIAGAPANTYVLLPAGSFTMSTGIVFNAKSGVELRGAGANQTLLTFAGTNGCQGLFADVCFMSTDTNYNGAPSNVANWTAGYSAGSTQLTLSSTANLAVGKAIMLDQLDDTTDDGSIFNCSTPACALNGDGGMPRPGRGQEQMVTVTAMSGSVVTVTPALVMPNWRSGQTPQAWWATSPLSNAGIANMSINVGSSAPISAIALFNAAGSWVKGIRVVGPPSRSHVAIKWSPHVSIVDSYFYNTGDSASVHYGVEMSPASDCLIQNNIFEQVQAPYRFRWERDGLCHCL